MKKTEDIKAYQKAYREAHKEYIKEYNKAYQKAHKQELYEKKKEYYKNNPEKLKVLREKQRLYILEHREELLAKGRIKAAQKRAEIVSKRVIEDLPGEVWKTCKVDEQYEISNLGRVKSLRWNKLLKICKNNKTGYLLVHLNQKPYYLHRLVAQAFIPNPENKPCIDHINRDKTDNRVENLRWVTHKENSNNPLTIEVFKISNKGKNFKANEAVRKRNQQKNILLNSVK